MKKIANKAAFVYYASKSPLLYGHLEDYYLGGVQELVAASRHCIEKLDDWFENGPSSDPWSLCNIFQGMRPRKRQIEQHFDVSNSVLLDEIYADSQEVQQHVFEEGTVENDSEILLPFHADHQVMTSYMPDSCFGSSLAVGNFLGTEVGPCIAVGAPYEYSRHRSTGAVYVLKLQDLAAMKGADQRFSKPQILKLPVAENLLRDQTVDFDNQYGLLRRFGAQITKLTLNGKDFLVVSSPGASQMDFYYQGQQILQLYWEGARQGFGQWGEKLIAEVIVAGDIDGDGIEDLIVGSPRTDYNQMDQFGRVDILGGVILESLLLQSLDSDEGLMRLQMAPMITCTIFPPNSQSGYLLFGSTIAVVKIKERPFLTIGAEGDAIVYVFKIENGQHARLLAQMRGDGGPKSNYGGSLLIAGDDGLILIGASSEDSSLGCTQCGVVYAYRLIAETDEYDVDDNQLQVKLVAKIMESWTSGSRAFGRFGHTGTRLGQHIYISSPFAKEYAGSLWRIDLNQISQLDSSNDTAVPPILLPQAVVRKGPKPHGTFYGSSLVAFEEGVKDWVVVGIPFFGYSELERDDSRHIGGILAYEL